ncbi:MAG: ATP-binding protein [Phycisphaerales bacterium]
MVSSIAKRLGFSDEAAAHIALAIDEALCNVIRHGYDKQDERPIWISLFPEGGVSSPLTQGKASPTTGLRIVIEDEAKQVDPSIIKSRDLDEIRPGGLGVHIIQQVMDSVNYEHRTGPNGGMRLTMVKRKGSQAGGEGARGGRGYWQRIEGRPLVSDGTLTIDTAQARRGGDHRSPWRRGHDRLAAAQGRAAPSGRRNAAADAGGHRPLGRVVYGLVGTGDLG